MGAVMEDEQRVIDPYEHKTIFLSFFDGKSAEYHLVEFPNNTWGFTVEDDRVHRYESRAKCVEDMTQNMKNFVLRKLNLPEED